MPGDDRAGGAEAQRKASYRPEACVGGRGERDVAELVERDRGVWVTGGARRQPRHLGDVRKARARAALLAVEMGLEIVTARPANTTAAMKIQSAPITLDMGSAGRTALLRSSP